MASGGSSFLEETGTLIRGTLLPDEDTEIPTHQIPYKETYRDDKHMIRKCVVCPDGQRGSKLQTEEKNILVLGETGCGKTTLLDGFYTYLFENKWDTGFRVKLTSLTEAEKMKRTNEQVSQTEFIAVYTVPSMHPDVPYQFNFIDTPGFGDTRGVERDIQLRAFLNAFFCTSTDKHGIDSLDAICIVTHADNKRLTPSQIYIYDSILSIFGKDVAGNIFVIATHANKRKPKVYKAIEEAGIKAQDCFKVDNGVLYVETTDEFEKQLWEMSMNNYNKFFQAVIKTQKISTKLTADVLHTQQQLQILSSETMKDIKEGCNDLSLLEADNELFEKHLDEMKRNENFIRTVKHEEKVEVKNGFGTKTLYCTKCKTECHHPCVPLPIFKWACSVIGLNGLCRRCAERSQSCRSGDHSLESSHTETKVNSRTETCQDVLDRYNIAKDAKNKKKAAMEEIAKRYNETKSSVMGKIQTLKEYQLQLNKIALKKDPLTQKDVIEEIIKKERSARNGNFQRRIEILEDLKQRIDMCDRMMESVGVAQKFERFRIDSSMYNKKKK